MKRANGKRSGTKEKFPVRLHDMMTFAETECLESVIGWVLGGRGFKIYNPEKLAEILSLFFGSPKYKSFLRQLNMWDFERISHGPNKGTYTHPYFVKGHRELCFQMSRQIKSKETGPGPSSSTSSSPPQGATTTASITTDSHVSTNTPSRRKAITQNAELGSLKSEISGTRRHSKDLDSLRKMAASTSDRQQQHQHQHQHHQQQQQQSNTATTSTTNSMECTKKKMNAQHEGSTPRECKEEYHPHPRNFLQSLDLLDLAILEPSPINPTRFPSSSTATMWSSHCSSSSSSCSQSSSPPSQQQERTRTRRGHEEDRYMSFTSTLSTTSEILGDFAYLFEREEEEVFDAKMKKKDLSFASAYISPYGSSDENGEDEQPKETIFLETFFPIGDKEDHHDDGWSSGGSCTSTNATTRKNSFVADVEGDFSNSSWCFAGKSFFLVEDERYS